MKEDEKGLRVTVQAKVKHSDLLTAIRKRGWSQRKAAEFVGMGYQMFCMLIRLQWYPTMKGFTKLQAERLEKLTGKTVDELFPPFMQTKEFFELQKTFEIERDITPKLLKGIEEEFIALPAAPDELYNQADMELRVRECINSLSERDQFVLREYFFKGRTYEDIATDLEVSHTRVQQLVMRALRRLRHPSRARKLRDFV